METPNDAPPTMNLAQVQQLAQAAQAYERLAQHAAQLAQMAGSIPYTGAGSLNTAQASLTTHLVDVVALAKTLAGDFNEMMKGKVQQ